MHCIKDVRSQTFPRRDFLKLALEKDNDLLLPKIMSCTFRRLCYFKTILAYNKKATVVKFISGKRTQFNITNITKQTFAAVLIHLEKRFILV